MRRSIFLFFFLLSFVQLFAQKASQIQLTSSSKVKGYGLSSAGRFIRPVFVHEGSTLAADSADYNQAANAFDAYGHVVITQPDGTVIYSDLLNYNGNTKVAILTNNVRMVDKDATLTTNHLTYNMGSKIGTYIGGGKIENAQNVITSKNGYYFANTRDAYFRYDAVVNSPDALIKTDTLKYNTETKIAWFYGPTNISGKGANKESKLYTENGRYNTLTDQAWFGKRNLYTENTKALKGDSLYYDGKAGFGRAINNITFTDTVQKIVLKGDLGIYRKREESALVTRNAYVVIETKSDSSKVDTIWMAADTLITKLIRMKDFVPATNEQLKSDDEVIDLDPVIEVGEGVIVQKPASAPKPAVAESNDTPQKDAPKESRRERRNRKKKRTSEPAKPVEAINVSHDIMKDSTFRWPPELNKSGFSFKPIGVKAMLDAHVKETEAAALAAGEAKLVKDTAKVFDPRDTMKTRVLYAFHHVKIFKSDLQSRSDSAFYSYADSIIRCYDNPVIWTQGSQLTADTIYLQMKNQKLDNMLLQNNGFVVSTENDSSKYNQVKGKVITGVFADNKLNSMFVDGNAESIYYTLDSNKYTGMNRSLSGRMRLSFADNKLKDVHFVSKPEGKYYPIEKLAKDLEVLDGFIWKPKERPKSKEEVIPALKRRAPAGAGGTVKKPLSSGGTGKATATGQAENVVKEKRDKTAPSVSTKVAQPVQPADSLKKGK